MKEPQLLLDGKITCPWPWRDSAKTLYYILKLHRGERVNDAFFFWIICIQPDSRTASFPSHCNTIVCLYDTKLAQLCHPALCETWAKYYKRFQLLMLVKDRGKPVLGALILPSEQRETLYCPSITCHGIIVSVILCSGFASSPVTTLVLIFSAFYWHSRFHIKKPKSHCSHCPDNGAASKGDLVCL